MSKSIIHSIVLIVLAAAVIFVSCAPLLAEHHSIAAQTIIAGQALPLDDDADAAKQETAATPIDAAYDEGSSAVLDGMNTEAEIAAITDSGPAVDTLLLPEASGIIIYKNQKATIDASNTHNGYLMVKYTGKSKSKIKVLIDTPHNIRYIYNLNNSGEDEVFPLTDGNGTYTVGIYENLTGNKYATAFSTQITVCLDDEFAPFLRPNQYVNFNQDSETVVKANELCRDLTGEIDKISTIYNYVISNFTYDKQLAATVQSGYLPVLDTVLANKKGICFDYAALMTGMLRSQGIPTKLVLGYSGTAYHAWINTYVIGQGWINGVIRFDGEKWELMDPTYASTAKSSTEIMRYINNTNNYIAKYLY